MKEVVLTAGPRGSGKSTFCDKIIASNPQISLVSRDAIHLNLFGNTSLNPYTGGHYAALKVMMDTLGEKLKNDSVTIILDCWNGYPEERCDIADGLRIMGADRIGAWHFITSEEKCVEWHLAREAKENKDRGKQTDDLVTDIHANSCRRDYQLFHSFPVDLEQGFDYIVRIDAMYPPAFDTLFG